MNDLKRCKLSKIASTNNKPNALRTDTVEGSCSAFPSKGTRFQMLSRPLTEEAGVRWVSTSTVKKVTSTVFPNPNETTVLISFMTENSVYELEVFFDDLDP